MVAMASWTNDGAFWKAVDDESQKGGNTGTDCKKIKVDHTYSIRKKDD